MQRLAVITLSAIVILGCKRGPDPEQIAEARLAEAAEECPSDKFNLLFLVNRANGARGSIAVAVQNNDTPTKLDVVKLESTDEHDMYQTCITHDADKEIHGSVTAKADSGDKAYMNWSKRLIDPMSRKVDC